MAAERIGRETVQYVGNILKYYVVYRRIAELQARKEKALEAARRGTVVTARPSADGEPRGRTDRPGRPRRGSAGTPVRL